MGCCASTPSSPSSPYPTAAPTSSSRAINTSQPASHTALPRPSTTHTTSSQQPQQPALTERFNRPLRYPHVWTSKKRYTRRFIDRERRDYFDTRVDGRPEVWAAIKAALEVLWASEPGDAGAIATAQALIDAVDATLPTGNLANGVYDMYGWHYSLPEYLVSYPTNMAAVEEDDVSEGKGIETTEDEEDEAARRREEKGKTVLAPADAISVKVRLSDRGGNDVTVSVGKRDSVRLLTRRIMEESGLPPTKRLKIIYLGKKLKENESLVSQGWNEAHIVNAFVLDVVAP